jgi:hypothetical protein
MKKFLASLAVVLLFPSPALAAAEIVPGSVINLVARDSRIPVTISNPDEIDVEVTLRAESTSFRLEVQREVAVSIPAQSMEIAELPVRALANGPVEVKVWLEANGERISDDQVLTINVNYDIELFLLVSFGVSMFALMIVGIMRTTIKLRRRSVG